MNRICTLNVSPDKRYILRGLLFVAIFYLFRCILLTTKDLMTHKTRQYTEYSRRAECATGSTNHISQITVSQSNRYTIKFWDVSTKTKQQKRFSLVQLDLTGKFKLGQSYRRCFQITVEVHFECRATILCVHSKRTSNKEKNNIIEQKNELRFSFYRNPKR